MMESAAATATGAATSQPIARSTTATCAAATQTELQYVQPRRYARLPSGLRSMIHSRGLEMRGSVSSTTRWVNRQVESASTMKRNGVIGSPKLSLTRRVWRIGWGHYAAAGAWRAGEQPHSSRQDSPPSLRASYDRRTALPPRR